MTESKPSKTRKKGENLKTEYYFGGKIVEMEFGKPIKLPCINKTSQNITERESQQDILGTNRAKCQNIRKVQNIHHNTSQEQILLNPENVSQAHLISNQNHRYLPKLIRNHQNLEIFISLNPDKLSRINSEKKLIKDEAWRQLENYMVGPLIGKGSMAEVFIAKSKSGQQVAVKIYSQSSLADEYKKKNVEREIAVLKKIQHPALLRYIDVIHHNGSANIFTQLVENTSLVSHVKGGTKLSESNAKTMVTQICKALDYLHKSNIVHRDLKLQNILVSKKSSIKIIDFGFSLILSSPEEYLHDLCGTPQYIAPEVIRREGYQGKPADIWSLGILIFRLTNGYFPYKGVNQKSLFAKVIEGECMVPQNLSVELRSLLRRILCHEPTARLTVGEILKHDWLQAP